MLNKSTQIQARKFLTASKEPAKRSFMMISSLKRTVEEEKERLARLLEENVLGLYDY